MTIESTNYTTDTPSGIATVRPGLNRGFITEVGRWGANYALALIFLWFGCLKFTDFEVSGIAPLLMNSPLVMWWHGILGIAGTAKMLGFYEILTAILLAARPFAPRLAVLGGALGALCFLVTLSFMFTTPGVVQAGGGSVFALSPMPGQFLLKDVALLFVSIWILGASLTEAEERKALG